jgi:hypothetical protein
LAFVRRARDLGFGLDQARALLDLAQQPERDCMAVDSVARVHLAEVDRKLADLAALCHELADLVGAAMGGLRSAASSARPAGVSPQSAPVGWNERRAALCGAAGVDSAAAWTSPRTTPSSPPWLSSP